MCTVFDVAQYIVEKLPDISTMKLQKLVYYCQAWSLVWDDEPLFTEDIQAWVGGPAVPELYARLKGQFKINSSSINGDSKVLTKVQKDTIDVVLEGYGSKETQWLQDLTHLERPWKDARQELTDGERGANKIKLEDMKEYYGGL